jgi:HSP20 family protein
MLPVFQNNAAYPSMRVVKANRLDDLFAGLTGNDGGSVGRAWVGLPLAVWEDEDAIHVEAEMPGVADDAVDVTVHNGVLSIRAERKPEPGRKYVYNSRVYGRFERVVNLPAPVQTDEVRAELTNGVLSVNLPKSPEAKPRKITLRTGA